jgi:hypothetical protein
MCSGWTSPREWQPWPGVGAAAETAGFAVAAVLEREPHPGVEAPTHRAYLLLQHG